MSEQPQPFDVLIVGGGMVGASFALALDTLTKGALRIALVEGFPIPANTGTELRPSFDARATALAYGSRVILERLDLWSTLSPHVTAITDIRVSERSRAGSAELTAAERGWPALGYVVENARLGQTLFAALRQRRTIDVINPATVTAVQPGRDLATATIEQNGERQTLTARLVVIADGADSGLRRQLGIETSVRDYQQQALITNVSCERPHAGCAYERFTDWGPMALLPLNDGDDGKPRMALVWTMTPERAAELQEASDGLLLDTLQQRFGHRQGRFTRVGTRHCYDLRLVQAQEQVRRQIVLAGNAAHSLHPVAGQGFNLALRDLLRLAEVVSEASARDEAFGELTVLQRYLDRQSTDQWRTTLLSDRLPALFDNRRGPLPHLRRLGLLALDLNPALKNVFVDHTAGFHPGAALGR